VAPQPKVVGSRSERVYFRDFGFKETRSLKRHSNR